MGVSQSERLPTPTIIVRAFRSKTFHLLCALLLIGFTFTFLYSPLYNTNIDGNNTVLATVVEVANELSPSHSSSPTPNEWQPLSLEHVRTKYAFATFLAGMANSTDDHYFIATRILAYQLLHAPDTRSRDEAIPLIVLVTENVNEEQRARLRNDGAIIVQAEPITSDWVKTDIGTWQDVMTKLRLWELTQFERICFVDGDTVLVEPLDGVFYDNAVVSRGTGQNKTQVFDDEAAMPANYSFAGVPEMNHKHHFPPVDGHKDFPNFNYLNAGFFVFEPSLAILDYYLSLMNTVNKFDPKMPEQNLLNYAHRRSGNMPWLQLNNTWNIHYPSKEDIAQGVKSVHDKWWAPENDDLRPYMESWRWRMEGYFEARDALLTELASATRWHD
jgi:alpha-N-acetylglucosamine transferase